MQLGLFLANRGDLPAAEANYREALALNPQLLGGYLNLADLLRAQSRDDEARGLLLTALEMAPENGNALHALGLLETRSGDTQKALDYLRRAAARESQGIRHRFVYAIALHDLGQPREALAALDKLHRQFPREEQVLLAMANYSAELDDRQRARTYVQQLLKLSPQNNNYQQLLQSLSAN
jgi:tetratricopeptide (TPR) repeat protein